jgi:hypothetical protein
VTDIAIYPARRRSTESIPPRLVAAVLFVAAAAKTYQAWRGNYSPHWLWLQSSAEMILALWLASGIRSNWASRTALMAFTAFAIVTLGQITAGARSCGCFGLIKTPPIYTFLLDLLVVGLLIQHASAGIIRLSPIRMGASILVVLLGLLALSTARHKSAVSVEAPLRTPTTAIPPLVPDAVAVAVSSTEWLADLGTVSQGKTLRVLFELIDPADHDLLIRGVNVSCGCTSVPHPPAFIARMGQTPTELIVHLPDHTGIFDTSAMLTTNSPSLPPLALRIRAQIQ